MKERDGQSKMRVPGGDLPGGSRLPAGWEHRRSFGHPVADTGRFDWLCVIGKECDGGREPINERLNSKWK